MKAQGPLRPHDSVQGEAPSINATAVNSRDCDKYVGLALDQISGINIYDIFADVCLAPDTSNPALALGKALEGHPLGLSTAAMVLKNKYDPCESGGPVAWEGVCPLSFSTGLIGQVWEGEGGVWESGVLPGSPTSMTRTGRMACLRDRGSLSLDRTLGHSDSVLPAVLGGSWPK